MLQMIAEADPGQGRGHVRGHRAQVQRSCWPRRRLWRAPSSARAQAVAFMDVNSPAFPIALFGAAQAGRPFTALNYRLSDDNLRGLLDQLDAPVVVTGPDSEDRVRSLGAERVVRRAEVIAGRAEAHEPPGDGSEMAVALFTSGTTGSPKQAGLRHHHLTSYVVSSVEFLGAAPDEATLVSVPPYHVAAVAAALTSAYAGRRVDYLPQFDAEG
jgi:fatty-acyl-CoA synthase